MSPLVSPRGVAPLCGLSVRESIGSDSHAHERKGAEFSRTQMLGSAAFFGFTGLRAHAVAIQCCLSLRQVVVCAWSRGGTWTNGKRVRLWTDRCGQHERRGVVRTRGLPRPAHRASRPGQQRRMVHRHGRRSVGARRRRGGGRRTRRIDTPDATSAGAPMRPLSAADHFLGLASRNRRTPATRFGVLAILQEINRGQRDLGRRSASCNRRVWTWARKAATRPPLRVCGEDGPSSMGDAQRVCLRFGSVAS